MKQIKTRPRCTWLLALGAISLSMACNSLQNSAGSNSGAAPLQPAKAPADPPVEGCECACDCPEELQCRTQCVPSSRMEVDENGQVISQETELVCDMRCVPEGACAFDADCPAGEMCIPLRHDDDSLGDSVNGFVGGVCAPPPPETCTTDTDCEWYGAFTGQSGEFHCMSGQCVSDPNACDAENPCGEMYECHHECWEASHGSRSDLDDSLGEPNAAGCNPVGTCVPVGSCLYDNSCEAGETCRLCRFTGPTRGDVVCDDVGECVALPPEQCQQDADCVSNGWFPVEQGRCFSGLCVWEPRACDAQHTCAAGLECDVACFQGCVSTVPAEEGGTDTGRCETTETFCESYGICIPPGACRSEQDCPGGEMCVAEYDAAAGDYSNVSMVSSYGFCEPYDDNGGSGAERP